MAKITEISVWKSQKIQLQQYEPYDFAYGMKAELDEKDDPKEVKERLEAYVDTWLAWEVKKWKAPQAAIRDIKNKDVPF
jgi:hypothetical protein